tara:strand:- start:284 stop:958 length:675 start_codon:yes stop_codon:yes gene_type:complete
MNNFVKEGLRNTKEFVIFNRVPVHLDAPLINNDIILSDILKQIENLTHRNYFQGINRIRIGDYKFLNDRDINAAFHEGTIYLSNIQDDDDDIIDDILHEVAHNLERLYDDEIYDDRKLEDEFLLKRSKLKRILQDLDFNVDKHNFFEVEYNKEFDRFLYKDVTYSSLKQLAVNLFCSVYGATSLSEYYATGVQQYLMDDRKCLSELSPVLYKKIDKLNHLLTEK